MKRYTKDHEWIKKDGDEYTIGISEYALEELGEIVFVELPEPDMTLDKEAEFGTVESVKTVSSLYMPIEGKVTEKNTNLESEPGTLNDNDESTGWMIKIEANGDEEFEELMTEDDYQTYLESL